MPKLFKPLAGVGVAAFLMSVASMSSVAAVPIGNCGAKLDAHQKWEVVFRTEPTRLKAVASQVRIKKASFPLRTFIEVESCSKFEVATARFATMALAQKYANDARALGFGEATIEKS